MTVDEANLIAMLARIDAKLFTNAVEKRKLILLKEKIEPIIQKTTTERNQIYEQALIDESNL